MNNCRVDFYIPTGESPDCRLAIACRVTEKAFIAGLKIYIWCQNTVQSEKLDKLLWTFSQCSFIPHKIVHSNNESTPVAIGHNAPEYKHSDTIISVTDIPVPNFQRFTRIAEIIGYEETQKKLARERFRFYRNNGTEPLIHEISI